MFHYIYYILLAYYLFILFPNNISSRENTRPPYDNERVYGHNNNNNNNRYVSHCHTRIMRRRARNRFSQSTTLTPNGLKRNTRAYSNNIIIIMREKRILRSASLYIMRNELGDRDTTRRQVVVTLTRGHKGRLRSKDGSGGASQNNG